MKTDSGFTLLETLVAFAIFSLACVAILDVFSNSTRARLMAASDAALSHRASQIMAEAEAGSGYRRVAEGTDPDGLQWSLTAKAISTGLIEIELDLTSPEGRTRRFRTLRHSSEFVTEAAP